MTKHTSPVLPRRLQPYPLYKDSGIEWLGQMPAHWSVSRISELITLLNGYPFDSEYFVKGDGVPLVRIRDLNAGETEVNYIGPVIENAWIEPGDVIIGMDGDFNVARWRGQRALLNQRMCCLRPHKGTDSGFIAYLLPLPLQVINDLTYSTTVKHLSSVDVRKIRLGVPPEPDQRAIAAFLDRETAKIDALVAKKERLIELLQEQRTALITRAVTKGLDPGVSMKDSGVEWLGDVPVNWEVKRIKFIAEVGNGSTPSREKAEYWGGDYPWLNSSVVNLREVTEASDFVTDLALAECHLPWIHPPAVLVGITGEGRTRGMATVLRIEATVNQHLAFIRPTRAGYDAEYARYVLHAAYRFLRDESGGGGSTKGALTCDQLVNVTIPCPSVDEQRAITTFLDRNTASIDALGANVHAAIERLKELRTALISAAVTGKIDVREEVA